MRIELLDGQITLDVVGNGGSISSTLKDVCPCCSCSECYIDCDESQYDGPETEEQAHDRLVFNTSINVIESLILGHACAGVDVAHEKYQEGLRTCLDAYGNG